MYVLCALDEIKNKTSKGFQTPIGSLFAVKKKGKIYLYANECPHMGVGLEWQPDQFLDSSKQLIQCAVHGAQFLIDSGQCIHGPCSGQKLRAVPFEINENDEIILRVSSR
ncbi:Rieske (2Fe-2S) protein [Oceanospirillum maris]|uniref:Rieske (2Fe-2S) protein n=1 Tax=Oceanospirillum maris TaxID=64977 RepID=UPI00041C5E16|nr:Rieske 2Fe-2S domain-containing protein [Oceanospirillum maris]